LPCGITAAKVVCENGLDVFGCVFLLLLVLPTSLLLVNAYAVISHFMAPLVHMHEQEAVAAAALTMVCCESRQLLPPDRM
jgi:hypothetical protein